MLCQTYTNCPKCCTRSACRGKAKPVLENLGSLEGRNKGCTNVEKGLHPPFPDTKVTDNHQVLYIFPQEPSPVGGIASVNKQKCCRVGQKSRILGFSQPTIFGPKTKPHMETYTRSEQSQQIAQGKKIKLEIPETIRTSLQTGDWVTSIVYSCLQTH